MVCEDWEGLIRDAAQLEKYPIAKLITFLEREESRETRSILFPFLRSLGLREKAFTLGITGTPGAGKSSLIGELVKVFLHVETEKSMAIVAIDPSSSRSGGSILGDRTRVALPRREKRIYFRSQASQLDLGGVNPYTYHVIRLLRHFFDYVVVETVGIGQNEIEVSFLSDYSFLVLQPLGGDQVQFMKSGIMEIPDGFILNKMDEENSGELSYHLLVNTLEFLKDVIPTKAIPLVFKTSVIKRQGIEELWQFISSRTKRTNKNYETFHQLEKWVRDEYGRFGIRNFWEWKSKFIVSTNLNLENEVQYEEIETSFLDCLNLHHPSLFLT